MNNDRKVALLGKRLERANKDIDSLKAENQFLKNENKRLLDALNLAYESIEQINDPMIENREEYETLLSEFAALKKSFKDLSNELELLKKKYRQRMEAFLKKIANN